MRKLIFFMIFIVFFVALLPGKDKFFVSAGGATVFPVDSRFKDFYGNVQFGPELKAGFHFSKGFYLWLGYHFFSASYTVPFVLDETNAIQHFLACGIGWETSRDHRLQADFFGALVLAGFKEKGIGAAVTGSALGFEIGSGLRYFIKKKVFAGVAFSFSGARHSETGTELTLGGLRLSGNIGLRF